MEIAVLLYDRFTALDAVGPYEVLSRVPGARVTFVADESGPVRTDNGNLILDTKFAAIGSGLSSALHEIPGVLEHGLFLRIATGAIIGGTAGVRILGVVE